MSLGPLLLLGRAMISDLASVPEKNDSSELAHVNVSFRAAQSPKHFQGQPTQHEKLRRTTTRRTQNHSFELNLEMTTSLRRSEKAGMMRKSMTMITRPINSLYIQVWLARGVECMGLGPFPAWRGARNGHKPGLASASGVLRNGVGRPVKRSVCDTHPDATIVRIEVATHSCLDVGMCQVARVL